MKKPNSKRSKEGSMKKNAKKESGSSRTQKAEARIKQSKILKELCDEIAWRFDVAAHDGEVEGPYPLTLVDQEIVPWVDLCDFNDEAKWGRLSEAMRTSFAFGYVLGQMFDIPDIDITPIKELLKERKVLLYVPREKKAA